MAHDHDGWRSLGFRGLPPMSGRVNQEVEGGFAPLIVARIEGQHAPFVGITADGVVQTGLRRLDSCATGAHGADRRRRARVRASALFGAASPGLLADGRPGLANLDQRARRVLAARRVAR